MPPPPVTPSPHRFVIKKSAPVRRTPLVQEQTPRSSTQQFKATPRFTFSSTPRPTPTQALPSSTPSVSRFTTPARHETFQDGTDNIESSFEEPTHDASESEGHDLESGYLSDGYNITGHNPKRRRLSTPSQLEEPREEVHEALPILSSPTTSRRPISSTAPRFLHSTPLPSSTPQVPQSTQPFLKPPRFRPPDPAEQTQSEPLPEQFSPHRRGQKYIAGGLASEVRDWLINIESTIPSGVGQKKDDAWVVSIVVDEVSGGGRAGMTMVRGRQIHGDGEEQVVDSLGEVNVVLAGEATASGLQRGGKVEVGRRVGIKAPVWEVSLEGVKWGVGVDWKILL